MERKRIVLLSDTHLRTPGPLAEALERAIDEADFLIHAGDFVAPELFHALRRRKPLLAALGNCDSPALAGIVPEVGETTIFGYRIAVMHGWGSPTNIPERIATRIDCAAYEMVVYGHSHFPDIRGHAGTLFVNPGSATERRFAPHCSYATLEITPNGITAPEIVAL